jgi:outer membrane receptor protein involved in Fe transport
MGGGWGIYFCSSKNLNEKKRQAIKMVSKILFQPNCIFLQIAFAALGLFLPVVASEAQQSGRAVVAGVVLDPGGRPVEFAAVYVKNSQQGAHTDAFGRFSFEVEPGEMVVTARSLGYETCERAVRVGRQGRAELRIKLEERANSLDELVVEGQSPVRRINRSAYNVVAINAEALRNRSLNLAGALDRVSGVKIREAGGVGSLSQISLNGFSGRHVKVFVDGMPISVGGSSFRLNNIPVAMAERIEVYKGIVPVELGGDALGGAVNIVSKRSRNSFVDGSYSFGSFNTHRSDLSFGYTSAGGFVFGLNVYQNYSDNNYMVKTKLLDLASNSYSRGEYWFERFHDNYHNEALIVKTGVMRKPWADRLTFRLTLSREKADIQNANLMQVVYGGKMRRAQSIIPALNYEKRNLFAENLNLSVAANLGVVRNNNIDTLARQYNWNGDYRNKSFKGEGQYAMGEYDNENRYVSASLNYLVDGKHYFALNNLVGGYSRQATDAAANSENSTEATFMRRTNSRNALGFAYKFAPGERMNLSVFVKRYDVSVRGPVNVSTTSSAVYEEQKRSFGATGGGGTFTVLAGRSVQLKASFEKAYRLPSENELFGDESLETGDMNLKPESSRNLNVNLGYDAACGDNSLMLDAGLIYRDTRDYIRRRIEQRYGGAFYSNHGKVRTFGIDAEVRFFFRKALSVGGNITWQDVRNMERYDVNGRELIYFGDRMPNVPWLFGNVDAEWRREGVIGLGSMISVGYNLRYIHKFFRDWQSEGGDITIPRQLSHDVILSCSLKNGRYNISAEGLNLSNELLYDNYSLQKPGRSFNIKLRYFFQRQ